MYNAHVLFDFDLKSVHINAYQVFDVSCISRNTTKVSVLNHYQYEPFVKFKICDEDKVFKKQIYIAITKSIIIKSLVITDSNICIEPVITPHAI